VSSWAEALVSLSHLEIIHPMMTPIRTLEMYGVLQGLALQLHMK